MMAHKVRELLKKAAMAAKLPYRWEEGLPHPQIQAIDSDQLEWNFWNPWDDNEDAIRLLIALRIDLTFEKLHTVATYTDKDEWFTEYCRDGMGADIEATTRRAIVIAAASMATA